MDAVRSGSRMQVSEVSHEPGMARLRIGLGRVQGLKPGEVVGIIASHANIPGSAIGRIQIQDNRSYVDVPAELVPQVIAGTKNIHIRSVRMDMQVA
jgi:ATP-dependent RNA helicase DeaD